MSTVNCEIKLDFSWSKMSITSELLRTAAVAANPPNPAREPDQTKSVTYQINNAKLYALVVILFINDDIKYMLRKYKTKIYKNNFLKQI